MQTHTARRWAAILDEAERSELTNREFARRAGVNPNTLAWWKWRLRRTPRPALPPPSFIELAVEASAHSDAEPLRLHLGPHLSVEVTPHTDLALLRAVVDALC